jgi:uracil-DNA glycosylase
MTNTNLTDAILATLPASRQGLFNPWADRCPQDTPINGPEARTKRLAAHMDCQAKLIVVGEFNGHLGARHSGIPFTSERQLLKGGLPRIPREESRLTTAATPMVEPTATIVWRALFEHKIAETTILWNLLPMHSYRPGKTNTNRYPSPSELKIGYPAIELLAKAYPDARFIALGKTITSALEMLIGGSRVVQATHPGHGGGESFAKALGEFSDR